MHPKQVNQDEKAKETGKYIRRERYSGSCQRSFYVGEGITQEDIKAEFKHGILRLFVPKKEAVPEVEEMKIRFYRRGIIRRISQRCSAFPGELNSNDEASGSDSRGILIKGRFVNWR